MARQFLMRSNSAWLSSPGNVCTIRFIGLLDSNPGFSNQENRIRHCPLPSLTPYACPVKLQSKGSKTNLFHWGLPRVSKRSEDPALRDPIYPAVPCEIHDNEERSVFHWGRSGRSYWGGMLFFLLFHRGEIFTPLNSKTVQLGYDSNSEVYRACPVGMKYRTGVKPFLSFVSLERISLGFTPCVGTK
jgi:hypothetical protein